MLYRTAWRIRALPWLADPVASLARIFDAVYTDATLHRVERLTVFVATTGFLLHLFLVFLARTLPDPPALVAAVGPHYLAAIYTPFSFILFYEVLLLILSIPESTTRAIGKQYEIISLIVIRDVFKDIAQFKNFDDFFGQVREFVVVLLDMAGGLVMFLLVALFYHASSRRVRRERGEGLAGFIDRKKAIALGLSIFLFALATYSLASWSWNLYTASEAGMPLSITGTTVFYKELFTVMIFTDVLILIVSMLHSDRYELVFRNAGFVISTILIRISLATPKPYNLGLAVAAIVFGILVLLIYNYFSRFADGPDGGVHGVDAAPRSALPQHEPTVFR